MAEIRNFGPVRHLRGEPSTWILEYHEGVLRRSGIGESFWFLPMSTGVAEVPIDDRELTLVIHGRTGDFQAVTVQGVITYRFANPEQAARRFDFTIDLHDGHYLEDPFDKLHSVLSEMAQQFAQTYVTTTPVAELLKFGYQEIRERIQRGLLSEGDLGERGVELVSVRISMIRPDPDLERALETPTREKIQERADEAAFERRAGAVEKERAIQENELNNRIQLSRREEELIEQEGQNRRREAEEQANAARIVAAGEAAVAEVAAESQARQKGMATTAEAERLREEGAAEADRIERIGLARTREEVERMNAYREMPAEVMRALALREIATKIRTIDHINITPDILTPLLGDLARAGASYLGGTGRQ